MHVSFLLLNSFTYRTTFVLNTAMNGGFLLSAADLVNGGEERKSMKTIYSSLPFSSTSCSNILSSCAGVKSTKRASYSSGLAQAGLKGGICWHSL
jgi:hypothetical protein